MTTIRGEHLKQENQLRCLICITPQSNSRRLIDKGFELRVSQECEVHILHVEKGRKIFHTEDSSQLLQELFEYGSAKGGIIHGMSSENVLETIKSFINKEKITHLVVGEPPKEEFVPSESFVHLLNEELPDVTVVVVDRN